MGYVPIWALCHKLHHSQDIARPSRGSEDTLGGGVSGGVTAVWRHGAGGGAGTERVSVEVV